jgi:CHASE2 domain-containing sensor protein
MGVFGILMAEIVHAGVATVNPGYGDDGIGGVPGAGESIVIIAIGLALGFLANSGNNDLLAALFGTAALICLGVGAFSLLGHYPLLAAVLVGSGVWYYMRN